MAQHVEIDVFLNRSFPIRVLEITTGYSMNTNVIKPKKRQRVAIVTILIFVVTAIVFELVLYCSPLYTLTLYRYASIRKNDGEIGITLLSSKAIKYLAKLRDPGSVTVLRFQFVANIKSSDLILLERFSNLKMLTLSNCRINDDAIQYMVRCEHLEELYLDGTDVKLEADINIGRLRELKVLKLGRSRVANLGMAAISRLPNLVRLEVPETQVGDAGVVSISQMPHLRYLYMEDTLITSDSIEYFALMPQLKLLRVPGSFTRHEIDMLYSLKPHLDIGY